MARETLRPSLKENSEALGERWRIGLTQVFRRDAIDQITNRSDERLDGRVGLDLGSAQHFELTFMGIELPIHKPRVF